MATNSSASANAPEIGKRTAVGSEPISIPGPLRLPPESVLGNNRVFGGLLFLLVVLLAFFLASSPVRNSDFWLHLASGKNLLKGKDPSFSYLSPEMVRINSGWLFDLAVFSGYSWLGGPALVVVKALLIACMAGLMVFLAEGKSRLLGTACVALALIAMGPWFSFRPLGLSLVFFSLTFWLLERKKPGPIHSYWPFLALFAFWANLDSTFILGLVLVGGYFSGQLMKTAPVAQGQSGPALLASLAGCLVNPHHVLVFLAGGEWLFSPLARPFREDPQLWKHFFAPLREVYFSGTFYRSGPGWAFWILTFLGLGSFAWKLFRKEGIPLGRALVGGGFFLLSFYQSQVIPFFAMAAGITLAWNLGDLRAATPRIQAAGNWKDFLLRWGSALTLLILGAGAWIGLFQSDVREPRSWRIEADPSMKEALRQLAAWRKSGALGDYHGFNFTPEAANYCAWFCPEEEGFLNSRLRLTPAEAGQYVAVRQALLGKPEAEATNWRDILRAQRINHVVVYGSDFQQTQLVFGHLLITAQPA